MVNLTKNDSLDKYKYSGHRIAFDSRSESSFTDGSFGKNVNIIKPGMSS